MIIDLFRIILGFPFLILLPGLAWSFVFFPKDRNLIDGVERVVLALGFSIVLVPLTIFSLNLLGVRINTVNIFLETTGLILTGIIFSFFASRCNQ